jgi:ABC-type spermidine/putrescine transport system permease subunit II
VVLSTRVQVAQRGVRVAFRAAAGAVGFFAVVGLYRSVFYGDPWWSFVGLWSLLICWIMLGVLLLTVWQALVRPRPPTNPWG